MSNKGEKTHGNMIPLNFNASYVGPIDDIVELIPDGIKKVLNVGCSTGVVGEQIKQKNSAEVVGIETNEQMARIAENKLDKVIFGTSLAVVLSTSLPNIVAAYLVINTLQCRIKDFCKEIFLPLANTIVVIIFIFMLRSHWVTEVKISNFLLTVISSILVYLGISFLFHKLFRYHQTLFDLVIRKISKNTN